jgi:hypothetical protein
MSAMDNITGKCKVPPLHFLYGTSDPVQLSNKRSRLRDKRVLGTKQSLKALPLRK